MSPPLPHPRTWRDATLDAIVRYRERHGSEVVDRRGLIAEELGRIIEETYSHGETPNQTLSRVLQELRDEGIVDFLGGGSYRIMQTPLDVEVADLTVEQIDQAIHKRLLRFGRVDTGTVIAESRQRKGQSRLRTLTLQNYEQRCATCDITEPKLLVASHILPWAEGPDARGDLANVVCICSFHDHLFELGYWSLTDDLEVLRRPLDGGRTLLALLPERMAFRRPVTRAPFVDYLAWHRSKHGFP